MTVFVNIPRTYHFLAQRVKDILHTPANQQFLGVDRLKTPDELMCVRIARLAGRSRLSVKDYATCVNALFGRDPFEPYPAPHAGVARINLLCLFDPGYTELQKTGIYVTAEDLRQELSAHGKDDKYIKEFNALVDHLADFTRAFGPFDADEQHNNAQVVSNEVLSQHYSAAFAAIGLLLPEFAAAKYVFNSVQQLQETLLSFDYAEDWVKPLCLVIEDASKRHDELINSDPTPAERFRIHGNQTAEQAKASAVLSNHYAPIVREIINTPARKQLMLRFLALRGIPCALPQSEMTLAELYRLLTANLEWTLQATQQETGFKAIAAVTQKTSKIVAVVLKR